MMDICILVVCAFLFLGTEMVFAGYCQKEEFQCHDGICIPFDKYQDTNVDCRDEEDEAKLDAFSDSVDCLNRHDIYGTTYEGKELRKVTEQGNRCSSFCSGEEGRGVICNTNNTREFCHVPFCGILSSDNRITCDFATSICGWQINSNATVRFISGSTFKITGQGFSKTVFISAINYDIRYFYQVKYSVNTPQCSWRVESGENDDRRWRNNNCTDCAIRRYYKYQDDCKWGKFLCDGTCEHFDKLHDGVRDCETTDDEGILYQYRFRKEFLGSQTPKIECSAGEFECVSSKSCIPIHSPSPMIMQCFSNGTSLPYMHRKTECPSNFMCRQTNKLSNQICITGNFICDGVPQCPLWDDEASCAVTDCPIGCSSCSRRSYRCLPDSLLEIPSTAISIDLSGHSLNLSDFCSFSRLKLISLNLSRCNLTDIECLSYSFPNLLYLDVSYNNIIYTFITFHYQINVNLDGNPLNVITYCDIIVALNMSIRNSGIRIMAFRQIRRAKKRRVLSFKNRCQGEERKEVTCTIQHINLSKNRILYITFLRKCTEIRSIDVSENKIRKINVRKVLGLPKLTTLILHDNLLTDIPSKHFFRKAFTLNFLDLSRNQIKNIDEEAFEGNSYIREIHLQYNQIKHLNKNVFLNLKLLEILSLENNLLTDLPSTIFQEQTSLKTLNLKNNRLTSLQNSMFASLKSLRELDLKNNNLLNIQKGIFSALVSLKTLDMSGNKLIVHKDMFHGLTVLKTLTVDKFSICCVKPKGLKYCYAPSVSISSCSYLLDSALVAISFWLFLCIILSGNIFLIRHHIKQRHQPWTWRYHASVHMTIADSLMGICIVIIGFKDMGSKGNYGLVHDEWKQSLLCDFVRLLSSISIDTTLCVSLTVSICNVLCSHKPRLNKVNVILLMPWVLSAGLSVTSLVIYKSTSSSFFSSQQICFLIPNVYRNSFVNDLKYNHSSWMMIWMVYHSAFSVAILAIEMFVRLKDTEGKYRSDAPISITAIAVRDLFICATGYAKMNVPVPEILEDLGLFVIPASSVICTISRVIVNSSQDEALEIEEIIPKNILSKNLKRKIIQDRMIVVLNRKPMNRSNLRENKTADLQILFSDNFGWKHTAQNIRILRNLIVCDAPSHPNEDERPTESVNILVSERSTGNFIAQSITLSWDLETCKTEL